MHILAEKSRIQKYKTEVPVNYEDFIVKLL